MASTTEELIALKKLLDQGILTQEEFEAKKAAMLAAPPQSQQGGTVVANDTGSAGWAVLGFCFPLVGLILFLVWKDSKPESSSAAGKGALVGVIVGALCFILLISCSSAMYSMYR